MGIPHFLASAQLLPLHFQRQVCARAEECTWVRCRGGPWSALARMRVDTSAVIGLGASAVGVQIFTSSSMPAQISTMVLGPSCAEAYLRSRQQLHVINRWRMKQD